VSPRSIDSGSTPVISVARGVEDGWMVWRNQGESSVDRLGINSCDDNGSGYGRSSRRERDRNIP